MILPVYSPWFLPSQIEYILVHIDDARQKAQVALKSVDILPILQRKENEAEENG